MSTPLSDSALAELADRQWRDFRNRTPGTYFAEDHPELDMSQAYAVQDMVARRRIRDGDTVAGFKVGCTGEAIHEQFGIRGPIRAHLYGSEMRASGATLDHGDFENLAIEGEMAIRIGERGEIAVAFPVIELHHFVFRRPRKTLPELIANNGLHAGVVLPAKESPWPSNPAALGQVMTIVLNDHVIDSGSLWPMSGGATASLDWLRASIEPAGLTLRPGDLVLAGTPLGIHPVKAGDHVAVALDGIQMVSCRVA